MVVVVGILTTLSPEDALMEQEQVEQVVVEVTEAESAILARWNY
jgi:hypothetical protein